MLLSLTVVGVIAVVAFNDSASDGNNDITVLQLAINDRNHDLGEVRMKALGLYRGSTNFLDHVRGIV